LRRRTGGEEIMETFKVGPCREIGVIKNAIREAILEGEIGNDYDSARAYMFKMAASIGLKQK
jgi:poly(A) polymerase